jgi:hypothetical protein
MSTSLRKHRFAFTFTFALALLSSSAFANGRFPKAQAIVAGNAKNELAVRTTFGVVRLSGLGLKAKPSMHWICEEALGFSGTWDPPLARDARGLLWVGLENGLAITKGGCETHTVPALAGEVIGDLSESPSGVIGVTASPGKPSRLFRQAQGQGDAITLLALGPIGMRFETLDAAPSNPKRMYVTGVDYSKKPLARLYRSDDAGVSLQELTPALSEDGQLFLSAIDPQNPDRIYLRQMTAKGGTKVLISTDGGKILRETLSVPVPLYGFARSPDGKTLLVSGGDDVTGVLRSVDRGEHWQPVSRRGLMCLYAEARGFYGCGNPLQRGGEAVLFSADRGETFELLGSLVDVGGPELCPGATSSVCTAPWEKVRARLDPQQPEAPVLAPALALDTAPATTVLASPSRPVTKSGCSLGTDTYTSLHSSSWGVLGMAVLAFARRRRSHAAGSGLVHLGGPVPLR